MQKLQEKLKELLLLSEKDMKPLLKGDIKALMAQNRDAVIRLGILYIGGLISVLLYMALFSAFGAFFKIVLTFLLFGSLGAIGFILKDKLIKMTGYPVCAIFFICIFGVMTAALFSGISADGSFLSKFLLMLIVAAIGGGIYMMRPKLEEKGVTLFQQIAVGLMACSLMLSLQMTGIRFSIDSEIEMAQRRSEMRRQRDAEQMSRNQASMKVCASEEECRKMNMKKNSYYAEHEEMAQEVCESAVAKEMPGRFEWTVSAKDYKFNRYEVDVLKDEIALFGDAAQLISNNNAKTKVTYVCRYNTKKKTALAASIQKQK